MSPLALPAPTALTATKRYISAGTRVVSFVPTIATIATPTVTELSAGTILTKETKADGLSGFSTTSETVDAPDYGARYTPKIAGMITTEDSEMVFYADKTGVNPVGTLLARDTTGYIVDYFGGIVTGGKMTVWPVTVTVSTITTDGAGDPTGWRVGFAVTGVPAENVAIPIV